MAVLGCLTVALALITVNAPSSPPNRTPLATGPGWRMNGASSIQDGTAVAVAAAGGGGERAWLAAGAVPGQDSRWASMVRFAMIDLHQLARGNGAVAAGAAARWGYAWPRDMAFVAVAMARTRHREDALRMLTFLQEVQSGDGGFEARYRLDGSGPPDDRPRQSDGPGWALWAMGEVLQAGTTPKGAADLRPLQPLLDRSTSYALRLVDDGRRLPPPPRTTGRCPSPAPASARSRPSSPACGPAPGCTTPSAAPPTPGVPARLPPGSPTSCGGTSPRTATSASAGTAAATAP